METMSRAFDLVREDCRGGTMSIETVTRQNVMNWHVLQTN